MSRAWRFYQRALEIYPIRTAAVTAGNFSSRKLVVFAKMNIVWSILSLLSFCKM